MANETVLIRCRSCGARNRIPTARLQDGPRCGRCKNLFPPIPVTNRPVIVTDRTFADEVIASPLPVYAGLLGLLVCPLRGPWRLSWMTWQTSMWVD